MTTEPLSEKVREKVSECLRDYTQTGNMSIGDMARNVATAAIAAYREEQEQKVCVWWQYPTGAMQPDCGVKNGSPMLFGPMKAKYCEYCGGRVQVKEAI